MTYHSIMRTKERAGMNELSSIRMIGRAKVRGKEANCFPAKERKYLEAKAPQGKHALYYSGFCFIFDQEYICITMFPVPIWFGKKMNYWGKEEIQHPRKYMRNNLDKFDRSKKYCFS